MEITLHAATPDESESIRQIQEAAFAPLLERYRDFDGSPAMETAESIRERFNIPGFAFYFIRLSEHTIGSMRIRDIGDGTCWLGKIDILPQYQGFGYAQHAIRLAESLYPHVKRWGLTTIKQEAKLRYLYEKMGYKLTGWEENIKDGMDLIRYSKDKNERNNEL